MPESARHLLESGERDKAKAVLRKIRGAYDVDDEFSKISDDINQSKNENFMSLFSTSNGRHALAVGCMLQLFQQFTGINTVMYYSATIIYMSGLVTDPSAAVWFAALTASMNFIFTLVGLWSIEKFGRRKLVMTSLLGCTVSLLALSGEFFWSQNIEDKVTTERSNSTCSNDYMNQGCSECIQAGCAFCFADGVGSCDTIDFNSSTYEC